jgi:hypothetical protein
MWSFFALIVFGMCSAQTVCWCQEISFWVHKTLNVLLILRGKEQKEPPQSNTIKDLISRICKICTRTYHVPTIHAPVISLNQNRWWTQLGIEILLQNWIIAACTQETQLSFLFFVEVKIQDAVANGEIVRECANRERLGQIILSKDVTF